MWIWPLAVMIFGFVLRTHHADVPLVDTSDWRQTDTATIAYFFYHDGIALLHPQLWHDGPGPDYTQLEFQITPAIVALLAHVFGYGRVLLHLVADGFFSLAVLPLWDLTQRRFGRGAAAWVVLVYTLLPLGIFFGRVFQPEPAQVFFGILSFWAVERWATRRTARWYVLSMVIASLAVLAKLPNGMILPALAAFTLEDVLWRWREMLRLRRLLEVAGLTLVPAGAGAAYTLIQGAVAGSGSHYVNFIVTSLGNAYIAGSSSLAHFAWHNVLGMAITPGGLAAGVVGAWVLARRPRVTWVWAWGVGIAIYAVVVLRAIRFQYYLMPILPWVALMAGIGLDHLARRVPELLPRALRLYPQIAAVCLVGSLLAGGLFQIQGYWPPYMTWYQQGTALDRTLPPGVTVILSGTFNPTLLYYARRHGYRVNPLSLSVLDADILGGASYLLDVGGISTCLAAYLNKTFPVQNVDGLRVYRLGTSPPPAPAALCSGGTA